MSEQKLPAQVPLPDVPHYTEDIIFGALDMPVGFDESSLLVSLRSFDRIRRVTGLSRIIVFAGSSEPEPYDAAVSTIESTGTATLGLAAKRRKRPLSSVSLNYDGDNYMEMFGKPEVAIKVDTGEIEARIEETDKYPRGVFDPQGRAKFLNKAVTRGISEANFSASISQSLLLASIPAYMGSAFITFLPPLNLPPEILPAVALFFEATVSTMIAGDKSSNMEEMKYLLTRQARYSLFAGLTPDRYLAGAGLIAASKLIRAREEV